jgi:hypothetical protein
MCCGSKNVFCKKSGAHLITAKVQTHLDSSEIGRSLCKIQNIPLKVSATKRELICVFQVFYYLCGVLCPLSILRFGSHFIKKPDFGTPKMKKHFLWDKMKIGLRNVPLHPKGHARVRYGLIPTNYDMIRAESSLFDLKVMQPRTW